MRNHAAERSSDGEVYLELFDSPHCFLSSLNRRLCGLKPGALGIQLLFRLNNKLVSSDCPGSCRGNLHPFIGALRSHDPSFRF